MLDILYEDNHLLVINKPAGIPTMGAEAGVETLHQRAVDSIRDRFNKPGRVYLGVVSRLDTVTSGVIVFARTSKAASRLSNQFSQPPESEGSTTKVYLAVADGDLRGQSDRWTDRVRKDDRARRMRVVPDKDAQEARLRWSAIGGDGRRTAVAVVLETGRKHQIRVQFADRGHAVIGDRKYGSQQKFSDRSRGEAIALHSWYLQIAHPTQKVKMGFTAPMPSSWNSFRGLVGGEEELVQQVSRDLGIDVQRQTGDSE